MYHKATDWAPWLQERGEATAFVFGAGGSYILVRGLQLTSKYAMNRIIPGFDEKWLPKLERLCMWGVLAAALIYSIADPETARSILREHQVYTSGMLWVYAGGVAGAAQDLHNRSKQALKETLEAKVN